jgi:hypothetical protein
VKSVTLDPASKRSAITLRERERERLELFHPPELTVAESKERARARDYCKQQERDDISRLT